MYIPALCKSKITNASAVQLFYRSTPVVHAALHCSINLFSLHFRASTATSAPLFSLFLFLALLCSRNSFTVTETSSACFSDLGNLQLARISTISAEAISMMLLIFLAIQPISLVLHRCPCSSDLIFLGAPPACLERFSLLFRQAYKHIGSMQGYPQYRHIGSMQG